MSTKKTVSSKKTIEERYQVKNPHEHVLLRPGMYIGSIRKETTNMWVHNNDAESDDAKIINKEITYVPGLYKIFDEILVNARDHTVNCASCNTIKININQNTGVISVWNNGKGIDIVVHKKTNKYLPTTLFGTLMSGENFDDTDERVTGGMNGLGAKLTNIYSKKFTVETLDSRRKKKFVQKFESNMYVVNPEIITDVTDETAYTKFTFLPDYERFGLKGLTDDTVALFTRRVYDLAATTNNCKIYLNNKLIPCNNFTKYIDCYFASDGGHKTAIDLTVSGWKVGVVFDPTESMEHQTISFVNGINTCHGGTHVDNIMTQIVNKLRPGIIKLLQGVPLKPAMIKENIILFVDATIVNPEFNSQSKETLKTKATEFKYPYKISDAFITKIKRTGIIDQIVANARAKANANMNKMGSKTNLGKYAKYYGAHKAGQGRGKEPEKCTLILTEGDSAKTFALSGLNVVGRDYYGIFPLKGKMLNVRGANPAKIMNNKEVDAVMAIMGLVPKKTYKGVNELRYGSIIILADQDVDGSHIKGLVINFIHYFWPSLIEVDGFIKALVTPLVKVTKGKKVIEFTTENAFDAWLNDNDNGKGWRPKYYKGLGTSTAKEAQNIFRTRDDRMISYTSKPGKITKNELEYEPKYKTYTEEAITMGYDKKRSDDRKEWMNRYDKHDVIDPSDKQIYISDFVDKELVIFSIESAQRAIPNIMDGFKPSLRKIFYTVMRKGINTEASEIKVAELSGTVSKSTAYHHGQDSLNGGIIGMAQNFVGSNNNNVLYPNGQFGSRLSGGKDAASPRYLNTYLNKIASYLFIKEDNPILNAQYDDGKMIEPEFFASILPMILINGTTGIGTGFSTTIPPTNPRDVHSNIIKVLNGDKIKAMRPWYRHFTGSIEKVDKYTFISRGVYTIHGNTLTITDLPVGEWTDNYKAFLDNLLMEPEKSKTTTASPSPANTKPVAKGGSKTKKNAYNASRAKNSKTAKVAKNNTIGNCIKSYTENCTDIRVSFTIEFKPGMLKDMVDSGKLATLLKLTSTIKTSNMHLFDHNNKIVKYDTYGGIINAFVPVRLEMYQKRKDYLLGKWRKEADIMKWKMKFVKMVAIDQSLVVNNRTKKKIEAELGTLGFPMFALGDSKDVSYTYLLGMQIYSLSADEIIKLKKLLMDKKKEIADLKAKLPKDMWIDELNIFMEEYDAWEKSMDVDYKDSMNINQSTKSNKNK
jgi:DNA topoisomerase-2